MNDRAWMLNAKAIRAAKECIQLVKQELGVRLPLAHPEFLALLREYSEVTESQSLQRAYQNLMDFADGEASEDPTQPSNSTRAKKVVNIIPTLTAAQAVDTETEETPDEMVSCGGKQFPRWRDGMEFNGVYRGQPRYR